MAIITLTTDWGDTDFYAAAVKGHILSLLPQVTIVDITHKIPPFDTSRAAYVLRNAFHYFPKGTVHIIGLNSEESIENPHLIVSCQGHYFIGTDNGIFSLIFKNLPDKIIILDIPIEGESYTFSTLDRFVSAAVKLLQGVPMEELGEVTSKTEQKLSFEPAANQQGIRGMVIHIDSYENIITNIPKELFVNVIGNKAFRIQIKGYSSTFISESYGDVREGELVSLFGSNGLLQIALNKANAASLLGVQEKDAVNILLIPEDKF